MLPSFKLFVSNTSAPTDTVPSRKAEHQGVHVRWPDCLIFQYSGALPIAMLVVCSEGSSGDVQGLARRLLTLFRQQSCCTELPSSPAMEWGSSSFAPLASWQCRCVVHLMQLFRVLRTTTHIVALVSTLFCIPHAGTRLHPPIRRAFGSLNSSGVVNM